MWRVLSFARLLIKMCFVVPEITAWPRLTGRTFCSLAVDIISTCLPSNVYCLLDGSWILIYLVGSVIFQMFKESAFSQRYGVPGIIDDSCFRLKIILNSLFYEQNIIFSTQGRDFYCLLRIFLRKGKYIEGSRLLSKSGLMWETVVTFIKLLCSII